MVILVCGSRTWKDKVGLASSLLALRPDALYVHGACRGADLLAQGVLQSAGRKVIACPADWQRHGRSAGPIRNRQMFRTYHPDMVVAFIAGWQAGAGTASVVGLASQHNVPVMFVYQK